MPKQTQKILGIDPGFADTGYGVIEVKGNKTDVVEYGNIKTPKTNSLPERLNELHKKLAAIIQRHSPNLAAVEELFFYKNAKTAIDVGQARGVIMLTIIQAKIPIKEFTPLQIKQSITGYGRANKKQMQYMLRATLGMKILPRPDDAADALAVALTAAHWNNYEHAV